MVVLVQSDVDDNGVKNKSGEEGIIPAPEPLNFRKALMRQRRIREKLMVSSAKRLGPGSYCFRTMRQSIQRSIMPKNSGTHRLKRSGG